MNHRSPQMLFHLATFFEGHVAKQPDATLADVANTLATMPPAEVATLAEIDESDVGVFVRSVDTLMSARGRDTLLRDLGTSPAMAAVVSAFAQTEQEFHAARGETLIAVTARQHDTVLAALRYWQRKGLTSVTKNEPAELVEIASEHGDPLTADEIDDLCEAINFA